MALKDPEKNSSQNQGTDDYFSKKIKKRTGKKSVHLLN
ncbi:hypothetical protein ANHS_2020 [Ligilactobacillus ruminis ATCC 25644]|nr:hypothetical protein ANHS_2020 [Ligilactobacillus ruminis ATCC 25644]